MMTEDHLTSDDLASIRSAIEEFEQGRLQFDHPAVAFQDLATIWSLHVIPQWPVEPPARYLREPRPGVFPYTRRPESLRRPEWDVALTDEFRKAIRSIERTLQGRILQAIAHISTKPNVPKGDTVKPLGGELKGLWRYRIGGYRLLYRPDAENARVVLVTFVARGGAYG